MPPPEIHIFVSSPGDVMLERQLAERVINRLKTRYARVAVLSPFFWEHEPLTAHATFQDQIPPPSEMDIVVCILWSRLGTPLPEAFRREDGTRYDSGTVYEFENAYAGWKQRGAPDLLVYRKTAEPRREFDLKQKSRVMEELDQFESLERFLNKWFHDPDDGTLIAAFHPFDRSDQFEETLAAHLDKLVARRLSLTEEELRQTTAVWLDRSPFRGLLPFDFEHAPIYFGRTKAVAEVIDALKAQANAGQAFVLVLGASGCGKSSLVRAGVLPILVQPGVVDGVGLWRRAILRPSDASGDLFLGLAKALADSLAMPELLAGETDLDSLAHDLRKAPRGVGRLVRQGLAHAAELARRDGVLLGDSPQARLVLAVDQLEEIFQPTVSSEERAGFVRALADLATCGSVCVLATLRSDFYHRCEESPELMALKEGRGQYHLEPATGSQLRQMIALPAEAVGLRFETDPETGQSLEEALLDEAVNNPEILPLLEFTLEDLYTRRQGNLLTFKAFEELGGLEGSLGRRAEAVLSTLDAQARDAFATVLRALVTVDPTQEERIVARTARLDDFPEAGPARRLVEAFSGQQARLLVAEGDVSGGRVRVAHEALFTRWDRAAKQIDADRRHLQVRARMELAEARWVHASEADKPSLLLPEGLPLTEAEVLAGERPEILSQQTLDYIVRSMDAAQERQRRARRRTRLVIAALCGLLCVALAGFALSYLNVKKAQTALAEVYTREGHKARGDHNWGKALQWYAQSLAAKDTFVARVGAADALSNFLSEWAVLRGHERPVISVAFSPDGATVASGSGDKTVRLWDRVSGKELIVLSGHERRVTSVAFSPDGKVIASGSSDETVRLWDRASGRQLALLRGHEGRVTSVTFSPDGKVIASGSDEGIRLWDRASGRQLAVLRGHEGPVTSVAFSPDGKAIASGSWDKTVRLWDRANGRELAVFRGHEAFVNSVAFSPYGATIVSGSGDKTVRLWDRANGKEFIVLRGHEGAVTSIASSPDGATIASGSGDGTICLWDWASGKRLAVLGGHERPVISVAFSPDGKAIASGSGDGTIRLWDRAGGKELVVFDDFFWNSEVMSFSQDGATIASAAGNGTIRLWDRASGKELVVLSGHERRVTSVAFSPDGKVIASGSSDETVRLWDRASGRQLALLRGHEGRVTSVTFSPDGKAIASGSDETIRLWDRTSGKQLTVLRGHEGPVTSVAFSPDGKAIASGADDNTVRLWDWANRRELAMFRGHEASVNFVAFSPDSATIASGSWDNTIRLWDPTSGRQLAVLRGHRGLVTSLAFSPDGTTIASGADDKTVRLWDRANGKELVVLSGHERRVTSLAFSPDGGTIASASQDIAVRLWDLGQGKDFPEHLAVATSIGMSFDIDVSGQLAPKDLGTLAQARLDAARAGRIWWREDGGKSLVPLYENTLEQAKHNPKAIRPSILDLE